MEANSLSFKIKLKETMRFSIKEREGLYTKGWDIEDRNNLVTSWYASSKTWRKMKDNGVGKKELLVAKSNKRFEVICRRMWYISMDEK